MKLKIIKRIIVAFAVFMGAAFTAVIMICLYKPPATKDGIDALRKEAEMVQELYADIQINPGAEISITLQKEMYKISFVIDEFHEIREYEEVDESTEFYQQIPSVLALGITVSFLTSLAGFAVVSGGSKKDKK